MPRAATSRPASVQGDLATNVPRARSSRREDRVRRDVAARDILGQRAAHEVAIVAGLKPCGAAPNSTSTDSPPAGFRSIASMRIAPRADRPRRVEIRQPRVGVCDDRADNRHFQAAASPRTAACGFRRALRAHSSTAAGRRHSRRASAAPAPLRSAMPRDAPILLSTTTTLPLSRTEDTARTASGTRTTPQSARCWPTPPPPVPDRRSAAL